MGIYDPSFEWTNSLKYMSLVGNIHTEICVKIEVTFIKIIQPFINKIEIGKNTMYYQLCFLYDLYFIKLYYKRDLNIMLRQI